MAAAESTVEYNQWDVEREGLYDSIKDLQLIFMENETDPENKEKAKKGQVIDANTLWKGNEKIIIEIMM